MRKILSLYLFVLPALAVFGAEKKYAASEISEDLLVASEVVVRNYEQKVFLKPDGSLEHQVLEATTILSESGDDWAAFYGPYDKNRKIRGLSGRIYDADGEQVEVLRGEDIFDVSSIASYSLYEDARMKIIEADYHSYPFTVEYTYTYQYKSFLELPDWRVYYGYNMSIEQASFEITAPSLEDFRYRAERCDVSPVIETVDDGVKISWELSRLPALTRESLTKSLRDLTPVVYIGPREFSYGSGGGDMGSWEAFGQWINSLAEGKRVLSEEETAHVQKLTASLEDPREKVEVLYKYMQDKVRYVNITMGIGGFEPIDAQTVSRVGYGDCKALSNYMWTLLDAVGIQGRYTLVHAGSSYPDFKADFPSQQFNHAILAVPFEKDTMWLECTSQRLPAGYLGSFTDNRHVLMVDDEGGKLVRTPGFSAGENLTSTRATCVLDQDLGATINYVRTYSGVNFGDMQSVIYGYDHEEQKRYIQNRLILSDFTLESFDFAMDDESGPRVIESADVQVRQMISPEGEYISLPLSSLNADSDMPRRSRDRKYPVFLRRGFSRCDTVVYQIPDNLKVHSLPEAIELDTEFGRYTMEASQQDGAIEWIRTLVVYPGEYPPEAYNSVYRFYRQISSGDKKKALLVRL